MMPTGNLFFVDISDRAPYRNLLPQKATALTKKISAVAPKIN
jgi:hypothetical protein